MSCSNPGKMVRLGQGEPPHGRKLCALGRRTGRRLTLGMAFGNISVVNQTGDLSDLQQKSQEALAIAIEQCNGAGVCRKAEGDGSVIPGYEEEQHSTRGRANLLRG